MIEKGKKEGQRGKEKRGDQQGEGDKSHRRGREGEMHRLEGQRRRRAVGFRRSKEKYEAAQREI